MYVTLLGKPSREKNCLLCVGLLSDITEEKGLVVDLFQTFWGTFGVALR